MYILFAVLETQLFDEILWNARLVNWLCSGDAFGTRVLDEKPLDYVIITCANYAAYEW